MIWNGRWTWRRRWPRRWLRCWRSWARLLTPSHAFCEIICKTCFKTLNQVITMAATDFQNTTGHQNQGLKSQKGNLKTKNKTWHSNQDKSRQISQIKTKTRKSRKSVIFELKSESLGGIEVESVHASRVRHGCVTGASRGRHGIVTDASRVRHGCVTEK